MSHSNKYLHCTKCRDEGDPNGMVLFVTPTGDLGVECMKHDDFVMVVQNDELSQTFLEIAMQPCGNKGCKCESEVSH